jgi:hypothetical protein
MAAEPGQRIAKAVQRGRLAVAAAQHAPDPQRLGSDASHAHYHFCGTGDGCADGYVNQNNYTNAWATFGTICTTDGTATITLADDGGDAYPAQVGADAIRAVHTGIAC